MSNTSWRSNARVCRRDGGAGLYAFTDPQANSEVRYQGYGVLKLTLGATSYAWEFMSVAGSSFTDRGTGECH